MSKVCPLMKKRPRRGYKYAIRGIAKKKKGIGLKVTGKTKRRFLPNLKKKRLWDPKEGRFITMRLSIAGLRTVEKIGLQKAMKRAGL